MTAKEYYAWRRAEGLCARCPGLSPDHSRCMACRRLASEQSRRLRADRKAQRVAEIRQAMPRVVGSGRKAAA